MYSQVLGGIDDLLEWFEETEKTIMDADPVSSDPDAIRGQLRDHKVSCSPKLVYKGHNDKLHLTLKIKKVDNISYLNAFLTPVCQIQIYG